MIYQAGQMGSKSGMTLITMLILPNIYLSEPSLAIGFVGSGAWLLKLVSGIAAAAMLLVLLQCYQGYIIKFHQGQLVDFYEFSRGVLGAKMAALLFIIWSLLFEAQAVLTLREFADYTMITTLPMSRLVLLIPVFSIAIVAILKSGLEVVLRAAYLLFIVAVAGIILSLLALLNSFDPINLMPWQGYGIGALAKYSLADLGTWLFGMAVFMIAPNLQNIAVIKRAICYGFGYTILLKTLIISAALMIFGVVIAPERALLFYEIVQAINLSQYLQRVDAAFIVIWLTGGLISALLMQFFALHALCRPFKINDMGVLIPLVAFLSGVFALLPDSVVTVIEISRFLIYDVGSLFFLLNFTVLAGGYFLKCRRNKSCVGATK